MMEDFIKDYFSLLNLKKMPGAVKEHYDKLVANNDFPNSTVKGWSKFRKSDGSWKDLPDFSTLSNDDLNFLYLDLLKTFEAMSSHMNKFDDDTKKLINTYFGANKIFNVPSISPAVKQQINDLINVILNDSNIASIASLDWDEPELLKEILNGHKKHEDNDSRRLIFKILKNLQQASTEPNYAQYLRPLASFNLDNIQKAIKPFGIDDIKNQNRDDLKNNCAEIFETLFKKKKAFEAFKNHEPGEKVISESIDKALNNTDYTGKTNADNYVAPTYKDNLNWRQELDKKLKDTYSDVLKKYLTLHRANLNVTKSAPEIIKQFDKAEIKPTDGIDAILKKADDITNNLKGKEPFVAADHFKWMVEKLKSYKNNGMEKAIEAALHNRRQMDHIIEQMIFDAADESETDSKAIDKAKTAMEVLSIMQYGMFTSRTMDAINKTEFNLFSDKDLSWNKNEGIKFVTNAFDKTIKTGVKLAGYTATALANKTFRKHSNVLDNSTRLKDAIVERKTKMADEKADFDAKKITQDAKDAEEIKKQEDRIKKTKIRNLDVSKKRLEKSREIENTRKIKLDKTQTAFNAAQAAFAPFEQTKLDYENWERLALERVNISREIGHLKDELRTMPNPAPDQYVAFELETKKEALKQKQLELDQLENQVQEIQSRYPGIGVTKKYHDDLTSGNYNKAKVYRDNAEASFKAAETSYKNRKNKNDKLEGRINEYEDARDLKAETEKQMSDRQEKSDTWDEKHKNVYVELWAHWEFLQSGKTKSLLHISTKKLQEKMDKGEMKNRYNEFYTKWIADHSYAT